MSSERRFARVFLACKGRPGMAEWAIGWHPESNKSRVRSNKEFGISQPQAALKAITGVFEEVSEGAELEVICNDDYITNGLSTYLDNWKENGWKRSGGGDIANKTAWQQLSQAMSKHHVTARRAESDREREILSSLLS